MLHVYDKRLVAPHTEWVLTNIRGAQKTKRASIASAKLADIVRTREAQAALDQAA